MNVTKSDGIYKISRITGPKHNYLGLALSTIPPQTTAIIRRRLNGESDMIDESKMIAAITFGIEDANRLLNTPLFAHSIEYVPSDTPDYSAYSQLAHAIVEVASKDFV